MKNYATILLSFMLFSTACKKDSNPMEPLNVTGTTAGGAGNFGGHAPLQFRYSGADYSQAISIADANSMIQSYLTSIDYPNNDSDLRSLTFDADTLRAYLNDTSHGRIVTLKLMLAHTPAYAQSSYGKPAGLKANAMTLVMVGLDENERYIYNRDNRVYEHFSPCPTQCTGVNSALIAN
jgi:hypothetical protein